jgi:ankyrin repeat protein
MGRKTSILPAIGIACLLVLPSANATTGLSSLAGLADLLLWLAYLAAYLVVFLLLIVFIRGRRNKVMVMVAFFAGLLLVPPFQFISYVGLHYIQPVNNLPQDVNMETLEVLGDHMLRRNGGELVYFPSRFGGNHNYWNLLKTHPPVSIDKTTGTELALKIYGRKKASEFRDIENKKYARKLWTIPLIADEIPEYRILSLTGKTLPQDWQASGEMLYGAVGPDSDPDWTRGLIARGAELDYQDPTQLWTPLHRAISSGQFEVAKVLFEAGASNEKADNRGRKPIDLLMSIYQHPTGGGDTPAIRDLLKTMENDWQATGHMLFFASHSKSDPAWITYLVKRGAPIDYRDPNHLNTALHLTVLRRQYASVETLIGLGAQKTIINKEGKTPEDYAREMLEQPAQTDDPARLRDLLELVQTGRWRPTGKMLHLGKDNPERIRAMMQLGANPEYKNSNGDNALFFAIQMKNYANAKALVLGGADLNGRGGPGQNLMQTLTMFIDKSESRADRKKRKELIELVKSRQ